MFQFQKNKNKIDIDSLIIKKYEFSQNSAASFMQPEGQTIASNVPMVQIHIRCKQLN